MPYFTSHGVDRVRQQLEDTCESLVSSVLSSPDVDLLTDLAEPLVLDAILSAMEVPITGREKLSILAPDMVGLLEPDLPPMSRRHAMNAAARATMLFERNRLAGCATGLHSALEVAGEGGAIPEKLARSTPVVVLHGGYENSLNQLGCVIACAVENPERFKHAAKVAPALLVEEIMRLCSPVRRVARWAAEDGELEELSLKRGDLVWIDLESANHDRYQFAATDELDLSKRQQHLGFGYGAHACPGTTLAKLEARILVKALSLVSDDELAKFTVRWRDGVVTRGPVSIARRYP